MAAVNHAHLPQCRKFVQSLKRLVLHAVILLFPVTASAYVGDYDGIINLEPTAITKGDTYSFDCRGNDLERQSIEVGVHPDFNGKIDWTLALNDTVGKHIIEINIRRIERNKYDFDHDERILLTLRINGREMLTKDFGHKISISKTPVFLRAQLDGTAIILSAGNRFLESAGSVPFDRFVHSATVSSRYDITLDRYSALFIPDPEIPQIYPDGQAVKEALVACGDTRCGIWEFFDEEVETEIALKGGRYKVALLPSQSGGYDIIYLSGASVDSFRWNSGALKGRLIPTPFADTFTLYWIDSTGKAIDDMTPYATVEGAIMSLVFPIQKAKFRFVKIK